MLKDEFQPETSKIREEMKKYWSGEKFGTLWKRNDTFYGIFYQEIQTFISLV